MDPDKRLAHETSSAALSQKRAETEIGETALIDNRLTDGAVPPHPASGLHPLPLESARKEYLSTKRRPSGLAHLVLGKPSLASESSCLKTDSPTCPSPPDLTNDMEGGVLLPDILSDSTQPTSAASFTSNICVAGGSPRVPLSPADSESSAQTATPEKKENAPRLPPHLRWREKLIPKTRDAGDDTPGSSQPGQQAKVVTEQVSRAPASPAESSRIKEQARLDSRSGAAKGRTFKGEEGAVVKYPGFDTRNATLAAAKADKPFPCPMIDCPAGYQTKKELQKHKDERHEYCKKCKLWFESTYMLHLHKVQDPVHIVCAVCSVEFYTAEARDGHVRQNHALDQEIPCHGCGKRFVRAAGIVDHIEKGHCEVISPDRLHAQRAEKTADFLQGRKTIQAAESIRAIENEVVNPQRPVVDQTMLDDDDASGPVEGGYRALEPELATNGKSREVSDPDEWPELGKGIKDLLNESSDSDQGKGTSSRVRKPALGEKFPREALRIDNPHVPRVPLEDRPTYKNAMGDIIFDPYDPMGNCEQFKNYDNKYKCYVPVCGKAFTTEFGFRAHLCSQVHMGLEYTCNACLKVFSSATALTSHLESASTRCSVKQSVDYCNTVGMASGGLVSVAGYDKKGNVIFGGAGEKEKQGLMLEANYNTAW